MDRMVDPRRTMRTARAALWLGILAASVTAGFGIGAAILSHAGAEDLSLPSGTVEVDSASPDGGPPLRAPSYPGPERPPRTPPPPAPVGSQGIPPAPVARPAAFAPASELEPSFTVFPGVIRPADTSRETPRYHVSAGTFATRQDALALGLRLESLGYAVTVFDTPPYRVRVGGYVDRTTAERLADYLRKAGFNAVVEP